MKKKFQNKLAIDVANFIATERGQVIPICNIYQIPLDMIDENPDYELIYGKPKTEDIEAKIKEVGFRGAIEVYKKPDGRFEIITGHRRVAALRNLGKEFVNAIILDDVPSKERAKMLLGSNTVIREKSLLTKAKEIQYYINRVITEEGIEGFPSVKAKAACYFNLEEDSVQRLLSLLSVDLKNN